MTEVKDREEILKSTRELPEDCQLVSQQKICRPEEFVTKHSKRRKARNIINYSISKVIILNYKTDKELPRQVKVKRVLHQTVLQKY